MTKTAVKKPAEQDALSGRRFLNRYIANQKPLLYLAVLAGSFATVLLLLQWVSFALMAEKIVLDDVPIEANFDLLVLFACGVLGQSLLIRLQSHFAQKASLNVRNSIRQAILWQWRNMSPVALQKYSAGASATQWVEEVEAMDGYFSRYWPQQMLAVVSPLLILCTVAYFNWLCAILLLISAPLIPLFMVLVGMGAEKLNQKYSTVRQRLAGHFLDRVANLGTIKLLGAQQEVFEEVSERSDRYRQVIMKTLKVAFLSSTVLEFFTSVAIASLAIYIGFSLYGAITWGPAQSLTLFSGLAILIIAPEFFQPLRNLSQYYHDRAAALGAASNLLGLLTTAETEHLDSHSDTFSNVHSNTNSEMVKHSVSSGAQAQGITQRTTQRISKPADCSNSPFINKNVSSQNEADAALSKDPKNRHRLQFRSLCFGHQQNQALTSPIDLSLYSGEMLVVSGSSGCGKTTLLNTIAGYLPALSGTLNFDLSLHKAMAYLPQKPWIKNDTIYNNLAVLAPQASKGEMLEVLQTLGLKTELTHTHHGLNTLIGEHGQGLSGGQMQRIALARVLLNPAPIVLLDEPTAKLDVHSKQFILSALMALKSRVILIVVTHDPALIDIADIHINLNRSSDS
ncbi:thiol reductant ABC exporter subunit CydD [Glaciecola sp. SC05]|uniref:thiol reductant ABC exporter subunit CydD n=1 Tax=Glaciecola sp. SC05 TaxID=1987355 RepID=UPI0035270BE7